MKPHSYNGHLSPVVSRVVVRELVAAVDIVARHWGSVPKVEGELVGVKRLNCLELHYAQTDHLQTIYQ